MKVFPHSLQLSALFGRRKYSIITPLFVNLLIVLVSEIYTFYVADDPSVTGRYIIFTNLATIIFFALRDGVRGGIISSTVSIGYYFFILYSRAYTSVELVRGVQVTLILGVIYSALGSLIGWLKETLDAVIVRETEARQFAEEQQSRLETILQQLPIGVLIADTNGAVTANKQIREMIGDRVRSKLVSNEKYVSKIAYKKGKALQAKDWPLVRALNQGEVIQNEEIEYVGKNHKIKYLRVNASPILNKQNQIIAAVSTVRDITLQKEIEQRKDDFVNMASHELKTPITSMKLYIELLIKYLENSSDERVKKSIFSVKRQTDRLHQLVNDLLDVSRIQTGKLIIERQQFNLTELILETIDIVSGATRKQHIVYRERKQILVNADRFRIYQVLTNLISNACKYSSEGSTVTIHTKMQKREVCISVRDRGMGMPSDQLDKVFERLYQVSDSSEKVFPGLGMGLYICREIIKKHKGKIWVESTMGKGSTFYFTLQTV